MMVQTLSGLPLFRLAARALRRDWRAGELRVLAVALVIAVASVAAVGLFTDRIQLAMERKSSELLAADLLVSSPDPIRDELRIAAHERGLQTTEILSFRSVVLAGDDTLLVEVKAVAPGYPLRGRLQVSDRPFGPAQDTHTIPGSGTVWLDERVLQTLRLNRGDRLELGAGTFIVAKVLAYEPDRGSDFFSIAPRLLMNLADVPATELVQRGSRVEHRLLVAGAADAVAAYRTWAEPRVVTGENLQGVRDARPEIRAALERAQRFLGLAAMISVILAGIGIAIAARRFAARHWDNVAIMRCVGATQHTVLNLYVLELLGLALLAGAAGLLLGLLAQEGLNRVLSGLAIGGLPPPSLRPLLPALAIGFITLLGFGLPPLLRLREVPPLRVLRRDLGPLDPHQVVLYGPALLATALLLGWQAGDGWLFLYVFAGIAGTLLGLGLAAQGLVWAMNRLRGRVGIAWRFGLANIARRGSGSTVQVAALGLGIMCLLVLTLIRTDLLASWQTSLPANAPNHFLINIQPTEVAGVQAFLSARELGEIRLYPMVRGRLVAINDQAITSADFAHNPRAQRLLEREFNLSWADQLQTDNRIVEGRWWRPDDTGQALISVEKSVADEFGITLYDVLRFQAGGREMTARVTSLRTVDWDSFHVNFFIIFPPGAIEDFPATWVTNFHLTPAHSSLPAELVRAYPSVTVIDVGALLAKVREIMDRVVLAVEYVFLFTLLAGLVVLYAAIQATQDERCHESAMLRTLGASRGLILRSLVAEFAMLGLLAGLLAALAATVLGWVLAEYLFNLPYQINPRVWLAGGLTGLIGIGAAGLWGTRSVVQRPPLRTLREM